VVDKRVHARIKLAATIGAAALVASACSTASTPTSSQTPPVGLAHIHGLGINPADGTLYAGTHFGVYRVAAGRQPELVSNAVHDFMGFTVIGPDHFLGSGHPAEHSTNHPPNLGLIESTDGGSSWTATSLNGTADFHALEYRDGLIVGLDSATRTVMVSTDTHTWQARAELHAGDVALSPRNPNELLATTAQGLTRSTDQARTFIPVPSAPPLAFVTWPQDGPLIGVDLSGSVYASPDDGTTWQRHGQLSHQPAALTAAGDGVIYVATDNAIYRSPNNGTTFETFDALGKP
jgi:hypothetical protein